MASAARSPRTSSAPLLAAYPSLNSRYSTARTAAVRSGSRCAGGTRYGMPASWILRFARTRRCAIVASGTRNARAISAVVRPASVRSVSATWASTDSAGWQQVKIRRSRSSATPLSSITAGGSSVMRTAASRAFAAPRLRATQRSNARLRAVVVSQAPGFAGTPSRGQRSSARANASCAHSSARSQSPVVRIRVATIRPHSSRNARATASSTS